jgi:ABC-type Fe3+/spermidine/putrescine transport system ATPase subunit
LVAVLKFKVIRGKQIQQLGTMVEKYAKRQKKNLNDMMGEFEGFNDDQNEEIKELLKKDKENKEKEQDDGNMMNRYRKDAETNTADKERNIKERKVTLSEKRVPKTIQILKIMIRSVILLIIGLSGFSLYYKGELRAFMQDG